MKSSNLRCNLACSQNEGLRKHQRRARQLWTSPSFQGRERGRWATAKARSQGEILASEMSSSTQTVSRLPVANQVLLGSWTVDIHHEGLQPEISSQEEMQCNRDSALAAQPGNRAAGTKEVIKTHSLSGIVCSTSTWSPELLRPGKGTNRRPN